ncbi:BCS1 N terminal-domain-containing protein [Stachybotrys elegans]|uniref:BCS1 N terminal-domain-containing protein n=1 Tax=Stachybotrys elegans TaxID=80388 RepID=A0A8K0WJM6_9HYPO|nr:BCS1 N terminal-domain-containing protein [Stachybotrys elegans]
MDPSCNNSGSGSSPIEPAEAPPQFALLDSFVPGFSVFSRAIHAYLGIDLNLYIPFLLVFFGAIFTWNYLSHRIWGCIEKYLMSSVKICTDDEIYNMIMAWIAKQNFSQRSRRFIVNTNINSRSWFLWSYNKNGEDSDEGDNESKKPLCYTPSFGTHYFWYQGHLLVFERQDNRDQASYLSASEREELSISCFCRDSSVIKALLLEAREDYLKKDVKKTLIYRGASGGPDSGPSWQRCMARTTRPFSTVILNEKTKKELIDDVTDYLDPATRRWYSNRGIPYRRGYLLHGPPGTGKSSLSLALAGFFQLRIYIVSLSSMAASEEHLSTLFADLPRKCVVLLEDIDSAGLTHTREDDDSDEDATSVVDDGAATSRVKVKGKKVLATRNVPTQRLSLSGLLNILDGVASQEGRVLIMTTNHIEKLDKALIRPGRVDMTVKFGLADSDMSASIFRAIYVPYSDEGGDDDGTLTRADLNAADAEARAKKRAKEHKETVERINQLAIDFASKIPEHEFSPAEIQGLLLRHKHNPEAAIEQVEEWIVQTRKEKKQKEIDDAKKRRKEEEEAKKKEREEKEKEEKEAKEKLEKEKEEEEEKKKKKRKEKRNARKKKSSRKDVSSGSDSSSDEGEEKTEKADNDTKDEAKEAGATKENTVEAAAEDKEDKSEKKSPADSGYDD